MLECLWLYAFVVASRQAWSLRHRATGAALLVTGYLAGADLTTAEAAGVSSLGPFGFFVLLFLGPVALPLRAPSWLPLPASLLAQPLWLHALRTLVCWTAARRVFREASQLNPLVPRAYALDHMALALTGAGVLDAVEAVVLVWARLLLADDASLLPRSGL